MNQVRVLKKSSSQTVPSLASQMDAQVEAAAELLKSMANPQRLRVLCLLLPWLNPLR